MGGGRSEAEEKAGSAAKYSRWHGVRRRDGHNAAGQQPDLDFDLNLGRRNKRQRRLLTADRCGESHFVAALDKEKSGMMKLTGFGFAHLIRFGSRAPNEEPWQSTTVVSHVLVFFFPFQPSS